MFSFKVVTIAAVHLAYPYLASDKFCGTQTDQDAESFIQLIKAATTWNETKTNFISSFSHGRNITGHRLEVEQCFENGRENFRNFFHRFKRAVDNGWLDDKNVFRMPNRIENEQHNDDNENRGTWNAVYEDLDKFFCNEKPNDIYWSNRTLPGITSPLILF